MIALLGTEEPGINNLASEPQAVAQGATRLDRGRNAFARARAAAEQQGCAFGWRLIEVPGVRHNAREMFSSPRAAAIFPTRA